MKNTVAKVKLLRTGSDNEVMRQTPLHEELAEWFYSHSEKDLIKMDQIVAKIQKLKKERENPDLKAEEFDVTYGEYQRLIVQCRRYLVPKYKVSLINVKLPGDHYGAYKLTNDAEGTYIAIRNGKRVMNAMELFNETRIMYKAEHAWSAFRRIFNEADAGIYKFKKIREKFINGFLECRQDDQEKLTKLLENGKGEKK